MHTNAQFNTEVYGAFDSLSIKVEVPVYISHYTKKITILNSGSLKIVGVSMAIPCRFYSTS